MPLIDAHHPTALPRAAQAVRAGQIVALPTDTVYGIGVDPANSAAIDRLLAAKGRGRSLPPPVLLADAALLPELASALTPAARRLAAAYWPGALTLVVTAHAHLGWDLGQTGGTVALRVPDDAVARALLAQTGPLAVTSANLHGHPPATTAAEVVAQLGAALAVVLDDGPRATSAASTIVDVTGPEPRILRSGAVAPAALLATGQEERR
ncbi:threonylcarbamoyl-AMP synthase [Buchananella hordeovulneris]|uniref:L-threonylcarbamoyladenylate synthase n=1 Tax=Buchananella hordeovulneris TaxID=52770 RepID=UPI000F5E2FFE|nr:L-threonylcarbamoyladenylate synthase [Buchananella hordeovulneris]RRD53066.1 threonylcarbamoyl-AMP synthase [Buchananella hordeovulneris]